MIAKSIATLLGAPEGAITLLLSLFMGYPLALLHRIPALFHAPPALKHTIFFVEGVIICYYNFGVDTIHNWLNVTIVYLVLLLCRGTKFSVIFVFVFNTCYLVIGYYTVITQHAYGISWTMPQCVLTLRLTGVAFDYYDGQKVKDDQPVKSDAVLKERPSYLEMLGHSFFFGGVLVGPQFSMKRYLKYVRGEFADQATGGPPNSVQDGLKRMAVGILYIAIFQAFSLLLPDDYLYAPAFDNLGFVTKCALILVWGKNSLHKYIGVWLLQEGSMIITGMTYNGKNEKGETRWDGCTNIKLQQLEMGESFSDFIASFNVNTNQWMSSYVFKRLRFLGNKAVSQLLTLFYLALWHGLHSGYYMCFFLELIMTNSENQTKRILKQVLSVVSLKDLNWLQPVGRVIRKLILVFLWSYALVGFVLLDYSKWNTVYKSVYYVGHIGPVLALIVGVAMRGISAPKAHSNGVHVDKKLE